jgi:methyl coenzyme M reductase alpha subunit
LFDFPILRLKPSADISTLYATSEDGNIVSLTLEIIENGAKICDEVRLNHLKSKGKGFYRYYLDGYNLDIRSEFITLKG